MRVRSSSRSNGFGMKSSAPASIAVVFSEPSLAVSMITGRTAVSSCARSCLQTARPSGGGIITSSSTRSGFADNASSSAASTVRGRDNVVAMGVKHRLEQAHVLGNVVDHEDPCTVVAHCLPPSQ